MSTPLQVGMVDQIAHNPWTLSEAELAFARAYLADGPMDPTLIAQSLDSQRISERERLKAVRHSQDWAGLGRHRDANAAIAGQPISVVYLGDSITEMWRVAAPGRFTLPAANRGISGQTSAQMLLRFAADVIALKPRALHLMCGVNDIAGNTGPTTPRDYQNNILAMIDLAEAHAIQVVLANLTPVTAFLWAPEVRSPRSRVRELNAWIADLANKRGLVHVDYYAALADEDGAFHPDFTRDGVHPTSKGYDVMAPICDNAIAAALT